MKTIRNKTQKPLAVPLPRGKRLFLGPGKTGQIASNADEHPPLKTLLDAGEIEIVGEGHGPDAEGGSGKHGPTSAPGHTSGGVIRRSGDR